MSSLRWPGALALLTGVAAVPVVLADPAPPRVLFADALDGAAADGWRRAPTEFATTADGTQAARYARGTTWEAETQPWVGDESWTAYRVEVEVLPQENWTALDVHVADDGSAACSISVIEAPPGQLALEMSGIWGQAGAFKLWPVGQRAIPFVKGRWVKLRLDVGGDLVNVYADDDPEPYATFYDLPLARGGVRLAAYAGSGLFRDLRITALDAEEITPHLVDPWVEARQGTVLRDWRISTRFEKGDAPEGFPVPLAADQAAWRGARVDGRGVVNLTSQVGDQNTEGVVFARTTVRAPSDGHRTLRVTYTDHLALWCNGEPVFDGPPRQWFHPDRSKYGDSRLIPDQFRLEVSLRSGDNDIVVRSEITEPFGWGFWLKLQ